MNIKNLINLHSKRLIFLSIAVILGLLISHYYMTPAIYNAVFGPFEVDTNILEKAIIDNTLLIKNPSAPFKNNRIGSLLTLKKFRDGMKFYFRVPNNYYHILYTRRNEVYFQNIYSSDLGDFISICAKSTHTAPQTNNGFFVGFNKKSMSYLYEKVEGIEVITWDGQLQHSDVLIQEDDILPIAFYNSWFYNFLFVGSTYLFLVIAVIGFVISIRNILVANRRLQDYTRHPIFKDIKEMENFLSELELATYEKNKIVTENWLIYDRFLYLKRYSRSQIFR